MVKTAPRAAAGDPPAIEVDPLPSFTVTTISHGPPYPIDRITLEDGSTHEIEYIEKSESGYLITPAQALREYDAMARKYLGMSGDEFLRRWDAGGFHELHDDSEHWWIGDLVAMRPNARDDS